MSWWRRRPTPPPLEHSWTDYVGSADAHLGFAAHIHLTVHPEPAYLGVALTNGGVHAGVPPVLSRAGVWARLQVETVTEKWDVLHRQAAQHDLNDQLARHLPHTLDGGAVVAAATAVLSVTADDIRAGHELLHARREAHMDELARRQIAATLRFLREECFDNPASARLFLMLNTNTRLGVFPTAQQADDVVDEVTRWHPDTLWVQVAKTLQTALGALTPDRTDELLRVLSAALHSTGHPDQARTIHDLRSGTVRSSSNGSASPPHDESGYPGTTRTTGGPHH
ncbi:hypothetical protein [Actinophytocola sediminis]